MKDFNSMKSPKPQGAASPSEAGFSPWQRLKGKRISYLTLPLLFMATVTEFVILATGWKYQQVVCLPQGMGVTFLGIGPIGATILAVELLKLPLAIWTASRVGWQKAFMLCIGLPLICVLTFQLVKDMAVYEMGVAMTPANQFLEKASAEEIKIAHLNDELKVVQQKKTDRDQRLAELSAKEAKLKGELEETLKRIDASRQDAINLTEYQKKELSEVDTRQSNIIKQFNADTETITRAISELRARREAEVGKATKWNAEEARIENEYKTKLSEYTNKKTAYDKAKKEYDSANFLHRQLMSEPVDPGVPPVREANTILKPTLVDDLEQQIKAKEAELVDINNKRRERVAQVDADARRIRSEFDQRSTTKRAESDKKRDELTAALATLAKEEKAEHEKIDKDFVAVSDTTDGMRAEIDTSRKTAEGYYEARETAIRKTQVHRIATTVEIVRGLIKGERPMSVKATAKERGDILTDQISMVRVWVYPVLAFIIAFLPTLMVEIGFSTIFQPEPVRPVHRLGFLGRRLHALEVRAGRIKNLREERLTSDAAAKIAARDKALAQTKAASEKALAEARAEAEQALAEARAAAENELAETKAALEKELADSKASAEKELTQTKAAAEKTFSEKEAELQAAQDALVSAQAKHATEYKNKETEWMTKLANMADSLNRTVVEKDALRDMQKAEIERQVQMRQNAWSDRMTQMRKELDEQRSASEEERNSLIEEHHKKLMEVTEDCKTQVIQARRQMADAELAAVEKTARLEHDLKEALHARDAAEVQLKHQTDTLSVKLAQAQEETNRQVEKITRQEKHRFERQQMEFDKKLRQRDEDVERQLKQCEHELSLGFDARLAEEKNKTDLENRRKMAEFERQFDARAQEVDLRWKQEIQQREDVAAFRLKQREEQLQTQFDGKIRDFQGASEEQLRRREEELERQFEAKARELETRIGKDLQAKEQNFQAKLKQREEELAIKAQSREIELQKQLTADLRVREEEWEKQAQARVKAVEARFTQEAQQKEEVFAAKSRQRDEQWQVKLEGVQAELRNATAAIEPLKAQVTRAEQERDEAKLASAEGFRQVQNLEKKLGEVSNFLSGWRNGNKMAEA